MSLLGIGTTALTAAQTSLATTSHNISNVNTEGYSRQRAEFGAYSPDFNGVHYLGNGVNVLGVERAYDEFLAYQVRAYTSSSQKQNTFLSFSKQVDELLSSDSTGLDKGMKDLFNAAHEVSNDPTSIAARQSLLSQAELLSNRFNTIDKQLQQIDAQLDNSLATTVDTINEISKGIAKLNETISVLTKSSGAVPNDLLDQRDQLVNRLSGLANLQVVKEDNGAYNVFIGNGQALVVGNSRIELSTINDTSTTPPRLAVGYGPSNINITSELSGGKIGGILQVRTDVIDATRSELDQLAQAIVTSFNTVQTAGVDLAGTAGTNIFDPAGTTAGTISVIMTDPRLIAASSTTNPGVANNQNALAMAKLQSDKTMSGGTLSFAESYNKTVSTVATKTMQADVGQQTQAGLLNQVKLRFDSVSGVNLDEEAANLIKFQQSYQAASQIISVSNTVFNALINAF
jgi:flagellar hook-associated protein 1 FlgK